MTAARVVLYLQPRKGKQQVRGYVDRRINPRVGVCRVLCRPTCPDTGARLLDAAPIRLWVAFSQRQGNGGRLSDGRATAEQAMTQGLATYLRLHPEGANHQGPSPTLLGNVNARGKRAARVTPSLTATI
jgi:hypothetical protein